MGVQIELYLFPPEIKSIIVDLRQSTVWSGKSFKTAVLPQFGEIRH